MWVLLWLWVYPSICLITSRFSLVLKQDSSWFPLAEIGSLCFTSLFMVNLHRVGGKCQMWEQSAEMEMLFCWMMAQRVIPILKQGSSLFGPLLALRSLKLDWCYLFATSLQELASDESSISWSVVLWMFMKSNWSFDCTMSHLLVWD